MVNKDDFDLLDRLNQQLEVVWVNICRCSASTHCTSCQQLPSVRFILLLLLLSYHLPILLLLLLPSHLPALLLLLFQMHIPGHAGYSGNEQADRLSREGAAKSYAKLSEDPDEYDTD